MIRMRRGIALALPALAAVVLLSITTICGGEKKMEPVSNNVKEIKELTPQMLNIGPTSISHSLFPVPQDNAVGTNDHEDAITIISFPHGKVKTEDYFKRAVSDVRGSGRYLPVIGEDAIGFGQTRRFLLYNFRTKTHQKYRIVFPIEESIEKIAIADAEKRKFIFEIQEYKRGSTKSRDFTFSLQLIDLSGQEVNVIKKMPEGEGATWTVSYDKLFLWYFDEKEIQVYDMNLAPSQHPLGDVIKQNKNKVDCVWITPHPFLPFAILSGGKIGSSYISWGEGRIKSPQLLFSGAKQFSFSPDGKWVSYMKEDFKADRKMMYIMPVSEKYPNYLGTPILIWDHYAEDYNCAWTKNPVSFVASTGIIFRWDLTNEAHPESDKPTFHEYVVEKDLERLAKEKKGSK